MNFNIFNSNTTTSRTVSQPRIKTNLHDHEINNNISHFITNMSESERKLFDLLSWWWFKFNRRVYPSQQKLADLVGVTRQYVNKLLGRLCDLGFITSLYRHLDTCIYELTSYFKNPFNTNWIVPYFPAFHLQSLLQLTQLKKILKRDSYLSSYINSKSIATEDFEVKIGKELLQKGRAVSEEEVYAAWDPHLKSLAHKMGLTKAGMVRMSSFPREALDHTYSCFKELKETLTGDYGRWLCLTAYAYCRRNNLKPNWRLSEGYADTLGITKEMPLTKPIEPQPPKTEKLPISPFLLEDMGFTNQAAHIKNHKKVGSVRATGIYKPWHPNPLPEPEEPGTLDAKIKDRLNDPNLSSFEIMLLNTLREAQNSNVSNEGE
jgi:hypothetical protein